MPVPSFSVGEVLTSGAMNQVGLWKVGSYSLTSGTSVTLTDCFPTDYTSFRLVGRNIVASGDAGLFIQFTTTGNGHYGSMRYDSFAAVTGMIRQNNAQFMEISLINNANFTLDCHNPNVAAQTTWHGTYFGRSQFSGWFGGLHNVATAYSSCNIMTGTSGQTFVSGVVDVYGYRS